MTTNYSNNTAEYLNTTDEEMVETYKGMSVNEIEAELNKMFTGEDNSDLAQAIFKVCK
jgi:hypothetical protein